MTTTAEHKRLVPLISPAGAATLRKIVEHPAAPHWNYRAGDMLDEADHEWLAHFARQLAKPREPLCHNQPPAALIDWLNGVRPKVPAFRERVPVGFHLQRDWQALPTTSREDLATNTTAFFRDDANLDDMVCYATSGTTGHVLTIPSSRRTAAASLTLTERALHYHGVSCNFKAPEVAAFLLGAQTHTVMHPTVLTQWGEAGYAKLNLHPSAWPYLGAPTDYFRDMSPRLLTGDPLSYAELLRQDLPVAPDALISTSIALSGGLRQRLTQRYRCPVIDWYSLNETGPLAYSCRDGHGFHWLPHDCYPEILDTQDRLAAPGQRGELTVTGGRNPFLPLLRYRTGDWCRLDISPCSCGDPTPRLMDLEGRQPVVFKARDDSLINPVDISRLLRQFPLVQHQLVQYRDKRCLLRLRMLDTVAPTERTEQIRASLTRLFGDVELDIRIEPELGDESPGGKVLPYISPHTLN